MRNVKSLGVILGLVATIFVSAILLMVYITEPVIEEKRVATLVNHWVTGDNDPGDNSGFFYFMIYPHQADDSNYHVNLSNASAYEYSDVSNTSATGETPYSTTFDILIKVGVTDEDGKNTTTGFFDDTYLWVNLTCSDLSISETTMAEYQLGNTTNYAWYQYWLNNSGSGYTITEGESFNITSVKYFVMRIT